MGLRFVYGKSGSGKSTFVFDEIKNQINGNRKIYIITPEQFSFTAERELLDVVGTGAALNAEVLTFNRMAYRVMNELKRANINSISSCGKSMLIYDILLNEKKNLKFVGKSNENVEMIGTQITEFKKHGITVENLKEAINVSNDKYLTSKMQDMLQIYEKYQNQINEQFIDENDTLTILANLLEKSTEFKNCEIYIDEFVGFTKQEFAILRSLLKNNNDIYLTVCTDEIEQSISPDTDIFYTNKQTLDKILNLAKQENIKIEEPVKLETKYRFKNEELQHLEENIYKVPYQKYKGNVQNIQLFLAKNGYSEIEKLATEIVKLVRDNNYRYNEIAVITKNLEEYSNLCKAIFAKYNIPVFIDEKKDLSQNLLVRYILGVLNIFAKNWSYEAVFEYIKTGFLNIDDSDINLLENYCIKWGINRSKWYKGEWIFYDETDELKEKLLHIREIVINPLLELKKKLIGQSNVKNITEKIFEFLIENKIDKKLEIKMQELIDLGEIDKAKEYETSWKVISDVLDELVLILGDKNVSFDNYASILKVGLGNSSLGKIPASQDQVIVGDVDRSRSHKVKAVFIIGVNDGVFPSIHKTEGFFNDVDREKLKNIGAELAKGTIEKLYDDNFNIYKAFSTAEEKIFLSYSSANIEGKSLRASMIINRIKKIFSNLEETSDVIESKKEIVTKATSYEDLLDEISEFRDEGKCNENLLELYNYYKNSEEWKNKLENSMTALSYTNEPEKMSEKSIDRLYGDTLKTSISKLEQYKSCPFSYYLKYGLQLSEKNELKIEAVDTGTFMHDVIDEFFDIIEQKGINVKQITDEEIKQIVDEIVEQKLQLKQNYIFTSIPKYRVLAVRLKKVILKSMRYIVDSLKYSKFEVLAHELEFKNGKEYEPIVFELDNNKKIEITGKIDRIDIAKTSDGNYIRIIDYKSSIKDINLNEVVAGLQLQLLTYLDAVCDINDFLPAGVLYFNLIDQSVKANSRISDEQIEAEIKKQFKMKGLILADVEVAKMMDTNLESGSSDIIPAYVDKEGNLSSKSNAVTRKQFESLQKYTKKIIKQISREILSGNIDIKPYYKVKGGKTPCDYCSYKTICNFNSGICKNSYYYIGNINKEAILEEISKEDK